MVIGSEFAVGILSSIVYDGLKRPLKGIVNAYDRKQSISKTLAPAQSIAAEKKTTDSPEISDLIRVIGNEHGQYTAKIETFLYDVERSSIPDSLKQLALCGRSPEPAYFAFELIYGAHKPLPFTSRQLFDALWTAISKRIEQGSSDKVLFDALKAQRGDLASRIEALSSSLEETKRYEPLSYAEYSELRVKIARGVETANRQIPVETTQGTRKINISKLIIPARLQVLPENSEVPGARRDVSGHDEKPIGYINFRRSFRNAVILGDPGGGKTTLTQLLSHDFAKQIVLENTSQRHKSFDSRDLLLPLRVVLRTFERRQQHDASYNILDYLNDEIRLYCDNDRILASRFLTQSLTLGQSVVIFDGLDEALEIAARRDIATAIEAFSASYAACPTLVTSRIVGYRDAPLSSEFQLLTLSRFRREEVKAYSDKLIRAVAGETAGVARKRAELFLSQTESVASDLRANPLLLGLMVYIFVVRGDVPNNRPEIYRECALLMFEKWDQHRDIRVRLPEDFDLLDLFGFLASKIFGNVETEDGVDEAWLVSQLRDFFGGWYENRQKAVGASRTLLEFITGRAWVMCEIGPHIYKFTHRTFLEYFFARRLEEESGGVTGLIKEHLISKLVEAQWSVVTHLALQIATFRSGPKSGQAVDALLECGRERQGGGDEETSFLTFLAGSVEYLTLPEAKVKNVVDYIFSRIVAIGELSVATEILSELLHASRRRLPLVAEHLHALVKPILHGPSSAERLFLLYLMGARYASRRVYQSTAVGRFSSILWDSLGAARDEARALQLGRARQNLLEAQAYIYVYKSDLPELYREHGLDLLFGKVVDDLPTEVFSSGTFLALSLLGQFSTARRFVIETGLPPVEVSSVLFLMSDDLLVEWKAGNVEREAERFFAGEEFDLPLIVMDVFRFEKRSIKLRAADRDSFLRITFVVSVLALCHFLRADLSEQKARGRQIATQAFGKRFGAHIERFSFASEHPFASAIGEVNHRLAQVIEERDGAKQSGQAT